MMYGTKSDLTISDDLAAMEVHISLNRNAMNNSALDSSYI